MKSNYIISQGDGLRLYSYISTASGLAHISKILSGAKKNNPSNGITGMMSYNNGYYFQVIEGGDENISELIDAIEKDVRHKDVQTIFDVSVTQRHFPNWSMKLISSLTSNHVFQAFMMDMDSSIEALSPQKHALLENFYRSPRYSYSSKSQPESWDSCAFTVDHWPDFSELPPTIELMSLCGSLFNNTMTYQQLSNDAHYGNEAELRNTLKSLNRAKCLVTSKAKRQSNDVPEALVALHKDLSFMSKMKEFISARLH